MDKYDEAIAMLTEHPDQLESAWCGSHPQHELHPAHCLFQHVTPSGFQEKRADGKVCGCLTLIRGATVRSAYASVAWTDELTKEIGADQRIPVASEHVTVADLPVFAEWQRKIDKELQRS